MRRTAMTWTLTMLIGALVASVGGSSQPPDPAGRGSGSAAPAFVSPEVLPDRRVIFASFRRRRRTCLGTDVPRNMQGLPMSRGDNGVWEASVGPLAPGAYRYHFNVNGVAVIDPRSPAISESNNNVWSLVYVPGSDVMDTRNVPHGAVSAVTYQSIALQKVRRMHVYTPPGYELGTGTFPVFYLLHGAGDNDESWTSVGRAGFILDNLIAAKKARPMIIVMPAGHTSRTPVSAIGRSATDEFVQDFEQDVMPYVEKHYRVIADRAHRAIAGLSMGGNHTLHVAMPRLDQFAYVGVFSSGLLAAAPAGRGSPPAPGTPPPAPALDEAWVRENVAGIDAGRNTRSNCSGSRPDQRIGCCQRRRPPWRCSSSTDSRRCSRRAREAIRG